MTAFLPTFHLVGNTRSGTTLLTKLLDAAPNFRCLEQPMPQLFALYKRHFLTDSGQEQTPLLYPHYQDDEGYSASDVAAYLNRKKLPFSALLEALSTESSSHLQALHLPKLSGQPDMTLSEAYRALLSAQPHCDDEAQHIGSKHILVEECAVPMLQAGIKTIFIIRDPRDVIVSSHFGRGADFIGAPLPLLYSLRNWRKSVTMALEAGKQHGALVVLYEDCCRQPLQTLSRVMAYLKTDSAPKVTPEMSLEDLSKTIAVMNEKWQGNSSFGAVQGISTDQLGRYKKQLPDPLQRQIEAICGPEMVKLGYLDRQALSPAHLQALKTAIGENHPSSSPLVAADYGTSPARIAAEKKRLADYLTR